MHTGPKSMKSCYFLHWYFDWKCCFVVFFHGWNEWKNPQFNFSKTSQDLSIEHNLFKWDGKVTKISHLLFLRIWKKKYLTQLAQKPKFWYLTHQSYPVHTTTGLTQNWPSFFHCSLECLKSHHHQVTNLLFNRTSTTYTLGGSRNSFRGLWRWCFWCSKTEKCIFTAVAKKKHSISVLKVKELTPQNQILAMNTLKSFKLNFLTAGVVYSIAQKRQWNQWNALGQHCI